jgi:hypothetical protein
MTSLNDLCFDGGSWVFACVLSYEGKSVPLFCSSIEEIGARALARAVSWFALGKYYASPECGSSKLLFQSTMTQWFVKV